jgi:hypothetical protein
MLQSSLLFSLAPSVAVCLSYLAVGLASSDTGRELGFVAAGIAAVSGVITLTAVAGACCSLEHFYSLERFCWAPSRLSLQSFISGLERRTPSAPS